MKLNKLKEVNAEKVRQAAMRNQYSDASLVSTFTPESTSAFSSVFSGEYISAQDFVSKPKTYVDEPINENNYKFEEKQSNTEVSQVDGLLSRVIARDPSSIQSPIQEEEPQKPELDYITMDTFQGDIPQEVYDRQQNNYDNSMYMSDSNPFAESQDNSTYTPEDNSTFKPQDNSIFTPDNTNLQSASEQIVSIDTTQLQEYEREEYKSAKKTKTKGRERLNLDKSEIRSGRWFAWLGYIIFFLPLIFKGKNRFVRIHANEGLELNIMEIIGAGLVAPYFLLTELSGTLHLVALVAAILGAVLLAACALTIIPMMFISFCGAQTQIPWLWKKRIIK